MSDWQERALEGVPAQVAQRYREMPDYLDQALRGVDDESKIRALRAMVNLGVRPDDETNVIIALLGYFTAFGKDIPEGMRAIIPEIDERLESLREATVLFGETTRVMVQEAQDQIETHALALGREGVEVANIEEMGKYRHRLLVATKEAFEQFSREVAAEQSASVSARFVLGVRLATALGAVVLVLFGAVFGWGGAIAHGAMTSARAAYVREGQAYVKMWNDRSMPAMTRAWIRSWSSRKP